MSKAKNKGTQSYNTQASVDPYTQGYLQQIGAAAQGAGMAGPSPLVTGASGYNTGQMNAGNLGLSALSGNQGALQQLMNPYTQGVIGTNNNLWNQINQQTQNQVNDRATQAGAFGGSRQGVATGVALAQNNLQQANQNATLLNNQYGQAMNQAQGLAGLGFMGSQANAGLGMQGVGNPNQWLMNMMKQGFIMPTGQTGSGGSVTNGSQTGFDLAKLAQAAGAMFGGGGGGG